MEQTSPKITPINKMREKCMNALTDEAIAIYIRVFPVVKDPAAAQDLTTSILIGMEHTVPLHSYNFDDKATDPYLRTAETAKSPAENDKVGTGKEEKQTVPSGKTPEQIAQDVKERGGDQASPEQKAKLDRLSKLHGSAPVEFPNEKGKALEEAAKPEPFDKAIKKWVCCPSCNKENITHERTDGSHITYQACFEPNCRVFLNADGTIKPMDRKKGERK